MNLEAIALRRAEESLSAVSHADFVKPGPKLHVVRKPQPTERLKCACGECHRCRNREAMRAARARKRAGILVPKKRGRQTEGGKVCADCGIAIWDKNTTGRCGVCNAIRKTRAGKVAQKRHHYSHGGGI